VLVIAGINYMNPLPQGVGQVKGIGVRKAVGGVRIISSDSFYLILLVT